MIMRSEFLQNIRKKWVFYLLFGAAVGLSIFQIWQLLSSRLGANVFRPVHLTWMLVLVFLKYPSASSDHRYARYYQLLDMLFATLAVACGIVILSFDYNDFTYLISGLSPLHLAASIIYFLLVLEATRRTVGSVMTILAAFFVAYNLLGRYLPGKIAVKAFTFSEFFSSQIYSTNGVFGIPLGIAAGVVFIFILFGALLESTKAGDFFTNISLALTGRFRGGPAKASVVASALLGSISGSAIANAVTTGTFTIPLMKKLGYKPEQAAGIEASASTGGQIMPPIMGAGAFIMAQFTGISYGTIVLVCFIPAIFYFFSTLLYVHIMACKLNLRLSEAMTRSEVWNVLKNGGHSFLSILFILILLVMGFTPAFVGLLGCGIVVLVSFLRRHTRITLKTLFVSLQRGAVLAIPVSISCATAGIIVGVVGQTGLGLQITNFILSLSQGSLLTVFLFTALIALVLGMGLPVTASYILLSIVAVPVFIDFGIELLVAHIVVFWLSQTSNVTPPIALAAFAAAGVADARPMKSAMQAFKLSSGLLLIPIMMLYSDIIFTASSSPWEVVLSSVFTLAVVLGLAFVIEGFLFHKANIFARLGAGVSVVALIFARNYFQNNQLLSSSEIMPSYLQGYFFQVLALLLLTGLAIGNFLLSRRSKKCQT